MDEAAEIHTTEKQIPPIATNPKRSGWKRWFFQRRCGKLNLVFCSLPCTSLVKRYDLGYAPEWFLSEITTSRPRIIG